MLKDKVIRLIKKVLPGIDSTSTSYIQALEDIINNRNVTHLPNDNPSISIIIFSKDRAIQLHALLASFFELVRGNVTINVLYTASSDEHVASYDELRSIFSDKNVYFKLESNFRNDLLELLNRTTTSKLMFLVDDIIFKESLDLDDIINCNTDYFVPTLRMGEHLSYSYTRRMEQPLPPSLTEVASDKDKIVWKWNDGQLDWAYPLSVDGHIFDTSEMRIIIRSLQFKAPNSLEESMQLFNPIYKSRYGLALKKSIIMNIPHNKVQQENDNHAGSLTADYLLKQWLEGYQINYRKLYHFRNTSAHQEVDIQFEKRD